MFNTETALTLKLFEITSVFYRCVEINGHTKEIHCRIKKKRSSENSHQLKTYLYYKMYLE